MLPKLDLNDYFKEVTNSTKFQLSATITFGTAMVLIWIDSTKITEIIFTILFLFPTCMLLSSLVEKIFSFFMGIYVSFDQERKKKAAWENLTPEEIEFIQYYIMNNTKTRYVRIFNGTYQDSGIINPLISKGILYMASKTSEFRGDSIFDAEQTFPFNIHDEAFEFFSSTLGKPSQE